MSLEQHSKLKQHRMTRWQGHKIYAQLHLSQDTQEPSLVDSCSSPLWFFVISCACAMDESTCPSLVLTLCALNTLSSSIPT